MTALRPAIALALLTAAGGCAEDDLDPAVGDSPDAQIPHAHIADAEAPDADQAAFEPPTEISVATYNVQNLFDVVDDPSTNEMEFTPSARWTTEKFRGRVDRFAAALAPLSLDVVALVEVESLGVLEALSAAILEAGGPDYAHLSFVRGPDARGIGLAVMSVYPIVEQLTRPIDLRYECTGEAGPQILDGRSQEARPILQVRVDTLGGGEGDLTLLVNHWRSKAASPYPCDELAHRRRSALELRGAVDLILNADPTRRVVALGDFNTFEFELPLKRDLEARLDKSAVVGPGDLYNTWGEFEALTEDRASNNNQWNRSSNSSYNYLGLWTRLDHVIVSGALVDEAADGWRLVPNSVQVQNMAPVIRPDGRPFSYDLDADEGYSDHLLVFTRFEREL